ncbi:MAG: hypothetical protein M1834_008548 [Cirrosporium novae-zelandiae]|nr:MAG: hypothetical protein M1834_008548 [Cirrosporium novae-zelandiae]
MSQSTDPGHFFQTTSSLETANRKKAKSGNKNGDPIKLRSKILALLPDPLDSQSVYVAESVGDIEKLNIQTHQVSRFAGVAPAPITCLALSPDGKTIFAGSWDKRIYWLPTSQPRAKPQSVVAHTDFVKSLLCCRVGQDDVLISGSADTKIIVWKLGPDKSLTKLQTLSAHSRGILDLSLDPFPPSEPSTSLRFFSAGSDREIRQWIISPSLEVSENSDVHLIIEHETSVFKLFFDADGDLWTASADGTARCLTRQSTWKSDLVVKHPDFVKDIVVDEVGGWAVTGCRDEEIRVWHRGTGKLHHIFTGHFEEVTGLALLGQTVVSVSIDGTVRAWSLKADDLAKAIEEADKAKKGVLEEEEEKKPESMLTAEEEAELAALMDDD